LKVIDDQEKPHPAENTVPRKKLDEWQRKDQARRSSGDGQNHKSDQPAKTRRKSNNAG
jgi:hypothetical protein